VCPPAAAAGCQSQRGGFPAGWDGELHRDPVAAGCRCRYKHTSSSLNLVQMYCAMLATAAGHLEAADNST